LTPTERRELVRGLAQKGISSIDEFLSRERNGGYIAERMEAIRSRIRKGLEEQMKARNEAFITEMGRLRERTVQVGIGPYDGELLDEAGARRVLSDELRGELLASELVLQIEGRAEQRDLVMRPSFPRKVWDIIKRLFHRFVSFLGRFVRWVRSLFRTRREREELAAIRSKRIKGAVVLPFPGLMSELGSWERELEKRLESDKRLQKAVDTRLTESTGYSSGVIGLRRSFDPEWYKEEAVELLRTEVGSIAERKERELNGRRKGAMDRAKDGQDEARKAREKALAMERELDREKEGIIHRSESLAREEMKREVERALTSMGYIQRKQPTADMDGAIAEYEITEALVERFSELVFSDLMETGLKHRERPGSHTSDVGVYDRTRLRTVHEEARLDILQTLVNARTNHPDDKELDRSDMIVYREVPVSELHAVILLDVSGSMEENMRLEAAKRAVLALYSAVRKENPRNRVDIITVSTRASPSTLREVLASEPRGFTNHSEAVSMASRLFEGTRSDRMLLFLITDGLPEAYTEIDGRPVAGDLKKAMERTLQEVSRLKRFSNLSFNIFMLEPKDGTYLNAARRIAGAGGGSLLTANPQDLALKLVLEYERGSRPQTGV
jgi:Mg-chelatase subunit ChlD